MDFQEVSRLLVDTTTTPGGSPRRVVELSTYHPGGRSGVDDWLVENADITRCHGGLLAGLAAVRR